MWFKFKSFPQHVVTIPFLLLYNRTRIFGFLLVILFHLLTVALFPIGMFPYIMIFSAIIFFSPKIHNSIISQCLLVWNKIKSVFNISYNTKIHLMNKVDSI